MYQCLPSSTASFRDCSVTPKHAKASAPKASQHCTLTGAPSLQHTVDSVAALQQDYDAYAPTYDSLDGGAAAEALGFPRLRQQLLQQASGSVLEVGIGTGLNLPLYDWTRVTSITGVDLSAGMLRQAAAKAVEVQRQQQLPGSAVRLLQGDVAALPLPDGVFDTVVDTFSLCVFPDPVAALQELRRVVKQSGDVLLLEHSRSSNGLVGWYQDITAEAVAATGKGCYWNQNVQQLLQQAGLRVVESRPELGGLLTLIIAKPA